MGKCRHGVMGLHSAGDGPKYRAVANTGLTFGANEDGPMLPKWLTVLLVLQEAWSARRDAHIRFLRPRCLFNVDILVGGITAVTRNSRSKGGSISSEVDLDSNVRSNLPITAQCLVAALTPGQIQADDPSRQVRKAQR